jgi:hypothetical protein
MLSSALLNVERCECGGGSCKWCSNLMAMGVHSSLLCLFMKRLVGR